MKLVLLNPAIPAAAMNFQHTMDLVGARFAHLPLGLATVAALTPGHVAVQILDECVEAVDPARIDADVVGLTGIYCQFPRLAELARALRARGLRVAIGGPVATDRYDDCAALADHVFQGEAELIWPQFWRDLAAGEARPLYVQADPVDLALSPLPRFDLLRADRYSSACVQATRGCPYKCEFCDVPSKLGQRTRTKSVEQVLAEVRALDRLGFGSIFFVDDMFIGHRPFAKRLLTALAQARPTLTQPMYYYTQVTLNVARDEELLALFHRARFTRFFVGVETSDSAQLRGMGKVQNTELDVMAAIRRIQAYNITVWAGIILGLDGDDAGSFDAQRRFIAEAGIIPTLMGLLQAMPGAPLWARARREGRLRDLPGVVGSAAFGSVEAMGTTNLAALGQPTADLMRGFAGLVRDVVDPDYFSNLILRAGAYARQPRDPAMWRLLNGRTAVIVARTLRWYLTHPEPRVRRMPLRLLGAFARGRHPMLDEIVFHLALYKHLRTFYLAAAERCEAAAERACAAAGAPGAP
jgi:radical SAM superfamily enzyme YgiQ (UPF0313 family)